jgi:hypothetical protein
MLDSDKVVFTPHRLEIQQKNGLMTGGIDRANNSLPFGRLLI